MALSPATNQYAKWAKNDENLFPPFETLLSNYPLPYNIRPDRTPINRRIPVDDLTGANFLHFNQCAIRVSLTLRRSGVDISGAINKTNPSAGTRGAYGNGNILGATNLAFFLFKFGKPEVYDGTKTNVGFKLKNRTGIIYFQGYNENYGSNRLPERSNSNVHIDLWNKSRIMSEYSQQMLDAKRILFWEIK